MKARYLAVAFSLLALSACNRAPVPEVNLSATALTYDECLAQGGRDAGLYPPVCIAPDGRVIPKETSVEL